MSPSTPVGPAIPTGDRRCRASAEAPRDPVLLLNGAVDVDARASGPSAGARRARAGSRRVVGLLRLDAAGAGPRRVELGLGLRLAARGAGARRAGPRRVGLGLGRAGAVAVAAG